MSAPEDKTQASPALAAADQPPPYSYGGTSPDEPPETNPEEAELDEHRMTLLEHLAELRLRLRNAAIAFVVAMIAAFFFVQKFFVILTRPVMNGLRAAGFEGAKIQAIGVTESFWVFMKLAIVAGLLIASPFVIWELWKFIAPGLYKKEKRMAGLVTGATALCFIGGVLFGYFVLTEPAVRYMYSLLKLDDPTIEIDPSPSMESAANFIMMMIAGCGVAFELPVVIALLGWLGIVSSVALWKFNKYAVVLSVMAGAVLTPSGDPFTQLLLAGPLFVLYQVSIGIVWLIDRGRKRDAAALESQYDDAAG